MGAVAADAEPPGVRILRKTRMRGARACTQALAQHQELRPKARTPTKKPRFPGAFLYQLLSQHNVRLEGLEPPTF